MEYYGRVFRPPSEAYSLILQATVGCSHNKCRFCDMYKEKRFFIRPKEEIIKELDEAFNYYPSLNRIFLGDGDALIIPTEDLKEILVYAKNLFPLLERITVYATPKSILNKSINELKELRENGLEMVYLGLESGDDTVLKNMEKGVSSDEMIEAARKVKEAGIKLSVTAISGLGGVERWKEHAINTAKVLSAMNPEYIGLLTLRAERQAPLVEDINNGNFIMLTPDQIMEETKLLLENIDSPGSIFRANHISNYVQLAGTLNEDKEKILKQIEEALEGKRAFKTEEERTWDLKLS